jgi:hypothetical protein
MLRKFSEMGRRPRGTPPDQMGFDDAEPGSGWLLTNNISFC